MKIRQGFVSNSSSSSYVVFGFRDQDCVTKILEKPKDIEKRNQAMREGRVESRYFYEGYYGERTEEVQRELPNNFGAGVVLARDECLCDSVPLPSVEEVIGTLKKCHINVKKGAIPHIFVWTSGND